MKKLIIFVAFLSFFACNQTEKGNVTDNTYDGDFVDSICREYEYVFCNESDTLALIEFGYVHGNYIPKEYIGNNIVVPDNFIRFHDETGSALILLPEFLAEKIQESTMAIYPFFLDSEGCRVYCIDIFDYDEVRITFFKYPFDENIISSFLSLNGEEWETNYFENDRNTNDIKRAFSDFNEIEETIIGIESSYSLWELFQHFGPLDSEDDLDSEEDEKLILI